MMPLGHIGLPLLPFLRGREALFDVRLLIIGGILPDLIDKPLGHLILPMDNGRIFAHTMVFAVLLLLTGLVFRRLLPLSLGVTLHHLFDNIYLEPGTALWPFLGPFPSGDFHVTSWLTAFLDPQVYGWELFGAMVLIVFLIKEGVRTPSGLFKFLISGRTSPTSDPSKNASDAGR
jgi:hypothetical protein